MFILRRIFQFISYVAFIIIFPLDLNAQRVIKVEYFFNEDPGFGNGINVNLTSSDHLDLNFQAGINQLSNGFHKLYLRAFVSPFTVMLDSTSEIRGGWSQTQYRQFYKEEIPVSSLEIKVSSGEYFFNQDPGFGNGIPIPVNQGRSTDSLTIFTPIDQLPAGFSRLYMRFRNSEGSWSQTLARPFYKEVVPIISGAPNLVSGEYFVNQDPGFGNGTSIPITSSTHLDSFVFLLPLENLPVGFGKLYLRFKDAEGKWSQTQYRQFYKEEIPVSSLEIKVSSGEYFFNQDPGFGNGIPIPVNQGRSTDSLTIFTPIDQLPAGFSRLYMRFRNSEGSWSQTLARPFYKEVVPIISGAPNLVSGEYFVNQDPGFGNGTSIPITSSTHLDSFVFLLPLENLPVGFGKLYLRFKDAEGKWSHTQYRQFYKEEIPATNFSNPIVKAEYFIDSDPGLGEGLPIFIPEVNDSLDLSVVVDLSTLRVGTHYLYVRAKNQLGKWGITQSSSFFVEPTSKPVISILNYPRAICTGEGFKVPFSMNTELAPDNVFTLQISSISDNFNNPVNIGSIISSTGDTINAVIPNYIPDGNGYRFRIISSAPKDTSAIVSNNVTVTNKPGATFNILGDVLNCTGNKTYSVSSPLTSLNYRWEFSGGSSLQTTSSTATINWNQAGNFNIKVISSNQCGDGFSFQQVAQVYSGVPSSTPVISVSPDGNTLTSSPAGVENQATGYQWFFNGVPLEGSTNMTLTFPDENIGKYSVRFLNPCGMGPFSVAYNHTAPKLSQSISFSYASGLIFGALPFSISAVASSGLPVELAVIEGPGVLFNKDSIRIYGAGNIRVQALQRGNSIYKSSVAYADIPVGKAEADVILSNLEVNFNGLPQHVKVSTSPSNLNIQLSYNGQGNPPVNAGTYQVIGQVVDNNYRGNDTATLLVRKAVQSITTAPISNKVVSDPFVLISGVSTSKLPVTVNIQTSPSNGVATLSGDTLRFSGLGSVTLTFTQAGNENFLPAPQVIRTFMVEAPAANDLSINRLILPATNCLDQENAKLAVSIHNLGASNQVNFDIGYRIGKTGVFTRKLVTTPLVANGSVQVEFDELVKFPSGESVVQVVAFLDGDARRTNDTLTFSIFRLGKIENMFPPDSTLNLDNPIPLNWTPVEFASLYDIYIWKEGNTKPAYPYTTSQVIYNFYDYQILYGGTYFWQVEARNNRCSTISRVQRFSIRNLPDLITREVVAPVSAFSEQSVSVTWKVNNSGQGSTAMAYWYDDIYLSQDTIFQDNVDVLIGSTQNLKALIPGQAYSHMASAKLPTGIQGNFYILVRNGRYLNESNKNNNIAHAPIQVLLNPPPDLIVTDVVIAPRNAFSGQIIEVSWKTKNQGARNTPVKVSFSDQVYLSSSPVWNENNAIQVGIPYVQSSLAAGATRNNSQNIILPKYIYGAYFVHVVTDRRNQVTEFALEGNNVSVSDTFNVFLTPPPDLKVSQVSAPVFVSNNQRVQVQWTVENQGGSIAEEYWDDEVYLGLSETFKPDSAIRILNVPRMSTLLPGENYKANSTFLIPPNIRGRYYLYVLTDAAKRVFELETYGNNSSRALNATTILTADVIIESVDLPDQLISGATLPIQWTIRNIGMGGVYNQPRRDEVYLSKSSVYARNPNRALDTMFRLVASQDYAGNLLSGQSLVRQADMFIPEGISGKYYLHYFTDTNNGIYEWEGEGNNRFLDSFQIQLSPWPDLIPLSINYQDTIGAGENFMVDYQVKNQGLKPIGANDSWMDQFYLYNLAELDKAKAFKLGVNTIRQIVPRDSIYKGVNNLFMPFLPTGYYYVFLSADDKNNLYEHTSEDNNVIRGKRIFIKAPPPVDFELSETGILNDTLFSGQNYQINWTVTNRGNATSVFGFSNWLDGIFLSDEAVLKENDDLLIRDFEQFNPVPSLMSYKNKQNIRLPNGISGDHYLWVVSDHLRKTNDSIRANNVRSVMTQTGQMANKFYVQLSPSPDLLPTYLQVPSPVVSGQPVQLIYRVKNTGNATTTVPWSDKIFFSRDFEIDPGDNLIGSKNQTRILQPFEEYTDTLEIFIPVWAEQNFVLIFKTEANNAFYEHNGEENNMVNTIIIANKPLPSDLVVSSVSPPEMAIVGENIKIDYEIGNIGKNPANGYMEELIYFSKDTLLDTDDVLAGKVINRTELIIPGDAVERRFSGNVPGLSIGDYYVIVSSDVRNNIVESSETNNIKSSDSKVKITVPKLPIDTTLNRSLANQVPMFFRIEVPDTLNGATLLISLDGISGENELFLSFGKMPSRSAHDFAFSSPSQPDQSIIVPELIPGTYYLMVYGASENGNAQFIKLKTQIIRFSILSVHSDKGGNTGNVTVRLDGAKFTPMMSVKLKSQTLGEITANRLHFINSTRAFATFNLGGAKLGTYDVHLTRNGEMATLPNGFTIVKGNPGILTNASQQGNNSFTCNIVNIGTDNGLNETVDHPANMLVNRVVPITIQYGNTGNVDIPVPSRFLISLNGEPLSFTIPGLNDGKQELYLKFQEIGGPPGILRPGSFCSISVYSFSKRFIPLLEYMLRE